MGDEQTGWTGHATLADGTHVPLSEDECVAISAQCDAAKAKRATDMPTEKDALKAMHEAWQRLTELGWREAEYCPKDGSSFDVIEAGSTGIFRASYQGDWPKGTWWLEDGGDIYLSRPILFRLDPDAEAARKTRMEAAHARYLAERDTDDSQPDEAQEWHDYDPEC